jgi:hypothetical protein
MAVSGSAVATPLIGSLFEAGRANDLSNFLSTLSPLHKIDDLPDICGRKLRLLSSRQEFGRGTLSHFRISLFAGLRTTAQKLERAALAGFVSIVPLKHNGPLCRHGCLSNADCACLVILRQKFVRISQSAAPCPSCVTRGAERPPLGFLGAPAMPARGVDACALLAESLALPEDEIIIDSFEIRHGKVQDALKPPPCGRPCV